MLVAVPVNVIWPSRVGRAGLMDLERDLDQRDRPLRVAGVETNALTSSPAIAAMRVSKARTALGPRTFTCQS